MLNASALSPYSLGGAGDGWGRTWTIEELDPGTFRVRLIDSSSHPNKDIRLDAIRVAVTYTP